MDRLIASLTAEYRRYPRLCDAAALSVCAALGTALPDLLAVAGRVLP